MMNDRDSLMIQLRPELHLPEAASELEAFQSHTMRPILKRQHDLIISYAEHERRQRRASLDASSIETWQASIADWLRRDQKTKAGLSHLVIALFTLEEYAYYVDHKSEVNKRITSMLMHRVADGLWSVMSRQAPSGPSSVS